MRELCPEGLDVAWAPPWAHQPGCPFHRPESQPAPERYYPAAPDRGDLCPEPQDHLTLAKLLTMAHGQTAYLLEPLEREPDLAPESKNHELFRITCPRCKFGGDSLQEVPREFVEGIRNAALEEVAVLAEKPAAALAEFSAEVRALKKTVPR